MRGVGKLTAHKHWPVLTAPIVPLITATWEAEKGRVQEGPPAALAGVPSQGAALAAQVAAADAAAAKAVAEISLLSGPARRAVEREGEQGRNEAAAAPAASAAAPATAHAAAHAAAPAAGEFMLCMARGGREGVLHGSTTS